MSLTKNNVSLHLTINNLSLLGAFELLEHLLFLLTILVLLFLFVVHIVRVIIRVVGLDAGPRMTTKGGGWLAPIKKWGPPKRVRSVMSAVPY